MSVDPKERRIHEEVDHHLSELEEQLVAEGMPREDARREARRRFGDPDRVERDTRAVGGPEGRGLPGGLHGDFVQALRALKRAPTFAFSVVLTLTLALGASIAVFGVLWDVLLRPLDLRDPETVVALLERMPEGDVEASPTSYPTFHDWRRELATVTDIVGWEWVSRTFEDPERPEELITVKVSGEFMDELGILPALGRGFTPADEVAGAPATTVILSHALWARRFGSDPGVIGRTLPIDGVDREVVGVMPARVELIGPLAQLYEPSGFVPLDDVNRGGRIVHTVARLAPGATADAASAEVAAFNERLAELYATSARGWSAEARPITDHLLGDVRRGLQVAGLAVGLLLLVAAVNVANLLMVRAADGRREMAVRAALGAGRHRLVRMRLVESLVLGLSGGAGGLALAAALQRWLVDAQGSALPRSLEEGVPMVAVAFGVALAAFVGLAVGAVPAVRGAESALGALGRGTAGGRGSDVPARSRHAMVVVQLGVTMVLLVGAGLLVRTVHAIRAVDVGFETEGIVAARISLDSRRYPRGEPQRTYYDQLLERVRAIPGVEAAGLTSALPMDPIAANFDLPTRADESTDWGEAPQIDFRIVDLGLMEALDFRLLEGRFFAAQDRGGPLVAVVNRSTAEAFWPGESAVGKRIQNVWRQDAFAEVVGVVDDTRFYGPVEASRTEMFVPLWQNSWSFMTVVARGRGSVGALQSQLERAVIETDPLLPPQDVFEVASLVEATTESERFYATLLSGFALLALVLAAAGVYGVLAYAVRLRTREMGVRLALGATRDEVTGMVLRSGLALAAFGVVLGLIGSVPSTRLVAGMLYGVEPLDPLTIAAVALVLVSVAAVACLSPALRAARLDPATVLREE